MPITDSVLEIIEAQSIYYLADVETPSGRKARVRNALISVTAAGPEGQQLYRGHGESHLRGSSTGDHVRGSKELIDKTLEFLDSQSIDVSDRATALRSVSELLRQIKVSAAEMEHSAEPEVLPVPFGGTLLGFEAALLRVAAQGLGISLAELLASDTGNPQGALAPVLPMLRPEKLLGKNAAQKIASDTVFAPEGVSVWVDAGERLSKADTLRWIKQLCEAADLATRQQMLYVYRPLRRTLGAEYPELVHDLSRVLSENELNRVVVVENVDRHDFSSPEISGYRGSYGVAIRPSALGSLQATLTLADQIRAGAETSVFLVDDVESTEVSARTLTDVASAHPAVSGVVVPGGQLPELNGRSLGIPIEHWEQVLHNKSVKVSSPGPIFRHDAHEKPNYYEEEKYLGPVGPKGAKLRLLQKAALLSGFNTLQYSQAAFKISDKSDQSLLYFASATPINSAAAKAICNHKETTRQILQREGVPVPQGRTFNTGDYETARKYAAQLGYPVVVKPAMGTQGIGVKAGIQNEAELDLAFEHLASSRLAAQRFIVEKHLYGEEYRILVIGEEVIAAVCREPASVVGDGIHSVAELILRKNRFRRTNPQLGSSPIAYTADTVHMLEEQQLTVSSVPVKDRHVVLSTSSNISQGGDSREILEQLHPTVVEASIRAVKAIPGLNYCGVDFLLEDPSLPLGEQSAGICELNAQAAAGTAEYPLFGTRRPVPRKAIEKCIEMFDMDVTPPNNLNRMALRLRVRGRVTGVGYRRWFLKWAREFGVVGRIRNVNSRTVSVEMMGNALAVAALSAAAVTGPPKAKPTSVLTEHIPEIPYDNFEVQTEKSTAVRPARSVAKPVRKVKQWLRRL